jgi:hypothetical protein
MWIYAPAYNADMGHSYYDLGSANPKDLASLSGAPEASVVNRRGQEPGSAASRDPSSEGVVLVPNGAGTSAQLLLADWQEFSGASYCLPKTEAGASLSRRK